MMSEVKWIKIATNIFDDEKIKLIEILPESDAIIVIWFKLLCLAGKQNNNGIFMLNDKLAYTDEMLSTIFRKPLPLIRAALSVFVDFKMIEIINNVITIPNWDKHQNIEGLEKIKEQGRLRSARYRENQKQLTQKKESNVTVTLRNALDIDIEKDIDIKEKNHLKKESVEDDSIYIPTLEEIESYCKENKFCVNPKEFYDRCKANNWKASGKPIENWKALLTVWEYKTTSPSSNVKIAGKPDWLEEYEKNFEADWDCL